MHIDDENLEKFENNAMNTEDMVAFLEHLDTCDFCLQQFIKNTEQAGSKLTTPVYLKEQILAKAKSPGVKAAKTTAATSRRMQLFYYSLRTAAGVVAALLLLFTIGQMDFESLRSQTVTTAETQWEPQRSPSRNRMYDFSRELGQGLSEGTGKVTDYLSEFSNKILNGGK